MTSTHKSWRCRALNKAASLFAAFLFSLLGLGIASGSAPAGVILPGQYFLLDHPDGSISPPPYGLRMDDLGFTFSTELNGASVVLTWNGGATATLIGSLWNNQAAEMWTVDYTLTGVLAEPGNQGLTATGRSGCCSWRRSPPRTRCGSRS